MGHAGSSPDLGIGLSRSARTAALALSLLGLVLAVPGASGARTVHLRDDPAEYRFRLEPGSPSSAAPLFFEVIDIDGDGIDEEVKVSAPETRDHRYMTVSRITEDTRLRLSSKTYFAKIGLCGASDLDGDGRDEVIRWQQTDDRRLRIDVLSVIPAGATAVIDTIRSLSAWDVAGALLPNGEWTGAVDLLGTLDLDGDGVSERLVLGLSAGARGLPRGVWLVDWEAGRVDWGLETGATPSGGSVVDDIDGDGSMEILVGLESPGNSFAAREWDDLHAYAVAIETDGSVLWSRELAGSSSEVSVAVGDLDSNGSREAVAVVGGQFEDDAESYRVAVLSGRDGTVIDEISFGASVRAVAIGRVDGGARLFAGADDGSVRRIALADGRLAVERELACGSAIEALGFTGFDSAVGGPALLVVTVDGVVALADAGLRALAVLPTEDYGGSGRRAYRHASLARDGRGVPGVLVRTGKTLHYLRLARNPLRPIWKNLGAVVAVLGALVCVPPLRRSTVATLRRVVLRGAGREETVDGILADLATASHGKLRATTTFRRLHDQLVMLSSLDGAAPNGVRDRFREAVENARDIGVPAVREIASRAMSIGLAPKPSSRLLRDLDGVARIVGGLSATRPERAIAGALRRQLDALLPSIADGLQAVRVAALRERSASLGKELDRVLSGWSGDLLRRGVKLSAPDVRRFVDVRVVGTPRELTFVFDNLLENAARAARGVRGPTIAVSVELADSHALVTVADNGVGIPPELHDEIFRPGVSERSDGGHGLPRSREILERRGGSIELASSVSGEGTTFLVRLAICP